MNLKIRDARVQDTGFILSGIRDILRMENCVLNDKVYHEKKKLTKDAIKNKHVRVATKENRPVGFSWFKICDLTPFGLDYGRWDRKYCWISYIYVSKRYRNQGIGSLLYDDITKICKSKRIKQIMLDVFTVNKKSARFHKKIGFKPILSICAKTIK